MEVLSDSSNLQRLRCSAQNYDWGRIGNDSSVARLFSSNSGLQIHDKKPYAEFWMGTHDSGPSFLHQIFDNGVSNGSQPPNLTLKSWISRNPNVLGDKVLDNWGCDLPFLFKVLSVAKALSIQAHPDKTMAGFLHNLQPKVYKDDNHKPEMILALTEFEALCGFICLEEMEAVLQNVPEIVEVVGKKVLRVHKDDREEEAKAILQSIFTQLMSASEDLISKVLLRLITRLNKESKVRQLSDKEVLVLQLEKQYPNDVGVIAAFLFNHVKLRPGEALCIGANELHAYIYGECVECMATSDNVVRAGLTPKNRDIKILCSMLTYKQGFPEILQGVKVNAETTRYIPPFDEFEVDKCILAENKSVFFSSMPAPSIFLVTAGQGKMQAGSSEVEVREGDALFAPADTEIRLSTNSELSIYRAGVNSRFLQQPYLPNLEKVNSKFKVNATINLR